MSHDPRRHTVSCEIDGKTFKGNYWIAGEVLVVSTAKGGKRTQLGAMSPETLAGQLLRKLAREGKAQLPCNSIASVRPKIDNAELACAKQPTGHTRD